MSLAYNGHNPPQALTNGRCGWIKEEDGEPCRAYPMNGYRHCFQHEPALEEERQALLAGQWRRAGSPILPEAVPLGTASDVRAMLEKVALYLITGERIEPRRVTALNGVADRLLRLMEIETLQAELAAARADNERLVERCVELERAIEQLFGMAEDEEPALPEARGRATAVAA
jgi:hypothetical protein